MNCLTCNYDRTGIDNDKPCPECGAPAPRYHRLARDRYIARIVLRFLVFVAAIPVVWFAALSVIMVFTTERGRLLGWKMAIAYFGGSAIIPIALVLSVWLTSKPAVRWLVPKRNLVPVIASDQILDDQQRLDRLRSLVLVCVRAVGAIAWLLATARIMLTGYHYVLSRLDMHDLAAEDRGGASEFNLFSYVSWLATPLFIALAATLFSRWIAAWIVPFPKSANHSTAQSSPTPPGS